jgi:hypothetical protein
MGQERKYLPNQSSLVFAYKKPVKESIFFANSIPFIVTIQNSHGESYVFAFKKTLEGPKLLTSFCF